MYATPEYYTADYSGTLISQDELPKALKDAEYSIDHLCFGRIKGKGYSNLSPYQQALIKRAVCLQADYIKQYGAGSTKVEMANVTYGGISTTQEIINLLEDTGLRCLVL